MKRKITTILLAALLSVGTAVGLSACANQEDIDNALLPVEQQVTLINTTLDDMKATDKTLGDSITALTGRVSTLETELVEVNAKITSLQTDSATKEQLETIKTALQNQIDSLNTEIANLKTKDTELQNQITALQASLTSEITDVKSWASETLLSIENWSTEKAQIESDITALNDKVGTIEDTLETMNSVITALQQQVDKSTQDIEALTIRVNCLEGKHVAEEIDETTYTWSDDFTTCTAIGTCVHCGTVSETANSTISDNTCTVAFTNKNFSTQTCDLTDLTNMTAEQQTKALSVILAAKPTTLTLNLSKDFSSFSLINDLIKSYDEDKYIDLTLKGVETIPNEAFSENAKLKSVTFGEGVKTIGESAFIASSLTSVNIGADVKTIGKGAFGFTAITEINIPDNVTTIENTAFYYCGSLTSVTLGKGISTIPYGTFMMCTSLKNMTIPSNITTVGTLAFAGSGLTSIVIPDTVTSLEPAAFSSCKALSSVTIGSGITTIESQTFTKCTTLESITIPSTVKSIGESAFSSTGLTSVTVPDSVTSLDDNAFCSCKSLTSITIGKGVTKMSKNVFTGDTALTEIIFRGVITEAEDLIFNNINTANITLTLAEGQKILTGGDDENPWTASSENFTSGTEFCGCTFKQIVLPIEIDTREMLTEQIELAVKTAVENGAIDLTIKFKANAGVEEFNAVCQAIQFSNWEECLNLTLTGVTEISTTVFYNYGWLKSITFGDGITTLGGEYTVMNFCGSLECATIGKSVTAINGTVFNDCASLEKIVYEGTVAEWNAITKVENWVKECPSVTEVVCSDGTITL